MRHLAAKPASSSLPDSVPLERQPLNRLRTPLSSPAASPASSPRLRPQAGVPMLPMAQAKSLSDAAAMAGAHRAAAWVSGVSPREGSPRGHVVSPRSTLGQVSPRSPSSPRATSTTAGEPDLQEELVSTHSSTEPILVPNQRRRRSSSSSRSPSTSPHPSVPLLDLGEATGGSAPEHGSSHSPQRSISSFDKLTSSSKRRLGVARLRDVITPRGIPKHKPWKRPESKTEVVEKSWRLVCGDNEEHQAKARLELLVPDVALVGLDDFRLDLADIKFGKVLGKGSFGTVQAGALNGQAVAVKKFVELPENEQRAFRREVRLMARLHHPNLLSLIGYSVKPFAIVTRVMPQGDLFSFLKSYKEEVPWYFRVRVAIDVAAGMEFLHSVRPPVLHGDLKSPNVLLARVSAELDEDFDENPVAKVADFGTSKVLYNAKIRQATERRDVHAPGWLAPEIIASEAYDERADVYSMGIILWELLSPGEFPFGEYKFPFQYRLEAAIKDGLRPTIAVQYSAVEELADASLAARRAALTKDPTASPRLAREEANRPFSPRALDMAVAELSPLEKLHYEVIRLTKESWAAESTLRPTFSQIKCRLRRRLAEYVAAVRSVDLTA